MEKPTLNALASAVIIYRASDPSWVFLEMKDRNYPIETFRHHLCPFGGRWFGAEAKYDKNPKNTAIRELYEELKIDMSRRPYPLDIIRYGDIRASMRERLAPFGDFFLNIPPSVLKGGTLGSMGSNWLSIVSYWTAWLTEAEWAVLTALQHRYGNLCNEGFSVLTSLDEILSKPFPFSWGSDRVVKRFWLNNWKFKATDLLLFPQISMERISRYPLESYEKYLEQYNISQKP